MKPVKAVIQVDSMDAALRNALWSAITLHYWPNSGNQVSDLQSNPQLHLLCQRLWYLYFEVPIDTLPFYWRHALEIIRGHYFDCSWNEVYDFVEFIADNPLDSYKRLRQ